MIFLDIGFIDDIERYCPALMEEPEQEDNIKSDESRIKRFLLNVSEKGEEIKMNQTSIQKLNQLKESLKVQEISYNIEFQQFQRNKLKLSYNELSTN